MVNYSNCYRFTIDMMNMIVKRAEISMHNMNNIEKARAYRDYVIQVLDTILEQCNGYEMNSIEKERLTREKYYLIGRLYTKYGDSNVPESTTD